MAVKSSVSNEVIEAIRNELTTLRTMVVSFMDSSQKDEIRQLRHECAVRRQENTELKKEIARLDNRLMVAYDFLPAYHARDIACGDYDNGL